MSKANIQLSFHVKHPSIKLFDSATVLGIEPFRIWTVGDIRKTPKGKVLIGTYDYSYCCFKLSMDKGEDVFTKVDFMLNKLENSKKYWLNISATGGETSLIIFNEGEKYFTGEFNWKIMARLSELKINLGFDC